MENLNAEAVKKALEEMNVLGLSPNAIKKAIALINSQEQRIGELTEELQKLKKVKYIFSTVDYCADDLAKALEKNKKLTEENESLKTQRRVLAVGLKDLRKETKAIKADIAIGASIRADTVRKMQERLNKECLIDRGYEVLLEGTIDQIAKEMLEGL